MTIEVNEQVEEILKKIRMIRQEFSQRKTIEDRLDWVLSQPEVVTVVTSCPRIGAFLCTEDAQNRLLACLMILLEQFDHIFGDVEEKDAISEKVEKNLKMLRTTDTFYAPKGGLLWYYEKMLKMFCGGENHEGKGSFFPPPVFDMSRESKELWESVYDGIKELSAAAEVYTVGGAGDRLKLHDERTGMPVPVAYLEFCGRSLLEHLFRDLSAREFFYYKVFGKKIWVSVLLMTSREKDNDQAILNKLEMCNYFGREKKGIRCIVQSLVPLIASNGRFVVSRNGELLGKPGGHGVIWKLAEDSGSFEWLKNKGVKALLVRQINNPFAGLDCTLSSLLGFGLQKNKAFGFASCPRRKGFAEGMNVLVTEEEGVCISNLEYTKFESLSLLESNLLESGECPANTNILFANIDSIQRALKEESVPGTIVNAKNEVEVVEGKECVVRAAARLESTMQNIADMMKEKVTSLDSEALKEELSTFLHLHERLKLISVTKRAFVPGQKAHETPEACFYDWYLLSARILEEKCGFSLPKRMTLEEFLEGGPNLCFFFHPALGPFWDVIAQKIQGGELCPGSELELEIAELYVRNLFVKGSFRLICGAPLGLMDGGGVCQYSEGGGRAYLKNVRIENKGLLQGTVSDHVKRTVERESCCSIYLEGMSELIAEDVCIRGDFSLKVPHGKRVILSSSPDGGVKIDEEEYGSSARFRYSIDWERGKAPLFRLIE